MDVFVLSFHALNPFSLRSSSDDPVLLSLESLPMPSPHEEPCDHGDDHHSHGQQGYDLLDRHVLALGLVVQRGLRLLKAVVPPVDVVPLGVEDVVVRKRVPLFVVLVEDGEVRLHVHERGPPLLPGLVDRGPRALGVGDLLRDAHVLHALDPVVVLVGMARVGVQRDLLLPPGLLADAVPYGPLGPPGRHVRPLR